MKHKLLFAAAAAALMAPSMAAAQDSGVYLRGQLGYGVFSDQELVVNDVDRLGGGAIGDEGGAVLGSSASAIVGDVGSGGELGFSAGLGYDFGNGWRLEGDYANLFNDFGTVGGTTASSAKLRAETYMLNVLYDFEDFGRFAPYIGGGLGMANGEVSASVHDFANPNATATAMQAIVRNPACVTGLVDFDQARSCDIRDDDTNFAWQLMAGLGFDVTDNLTWDTSYRYVDMGTFEVDGDVSVFETDGSIGQVSPLTSDLEDAAAHMVMTGFRYRFGDSTPEPIIVVAPEPEPRLFTCWDGSQVTDLALCPVEPAPEPVIETFSCPGSGQTVTDLALCPPRTECPDGSIVYGSAEFCPTTSGMSVAELCANEFRQEIIYYEFDRGQSAETRNTINRILDIGQFCQVDNIRVVGHTDTSGSAAYNLRLSQRRAQDALNELVRQGIDRRIITSEGKGETEPFVQTGDGVREQLNRRTEVLIQLSDVGFRDMSSGN